MEKSDPFLISYIGFMGPKKKKTRLTTLVQIRDGLLCRCELCRVKLSKAHVPISGIDAGQNPGLSNCTVFSVLHDPRAFSACTEYKIR